MTPSTRSRSVVGQRQSYALAILWGALAVLVWRTGGTFDEIVLRWLVSVVFLLHAGA